MRDRFRHVWERTDRLFATIAPDALLDRPIVLRHPFVFYLGHLPAFAWNHVCRYVHDRPAFEPHLDAIFDRGIDPDVDASAHGRTADDATPAWPAVDRVLAYRDRIREELLACIADVDASEATDGTSAARRALIMALEHEQMHQETLLYMIQQLDPRRRVRSGAAPIYRRGDALRARPIEIPAGGATLGSGFDALDFGWDNEFPHARVDVPAFVIDSTPVTNGEYLQFIEAGAYDAPELWLEEDRAWIRRHGLRHPALWARSNGDWRYRTVADELPLAAARDWPVYVSLAEARAYARWRRGRLPTEAEFHRAAYGDPAGDERAFPWGDEEPHAQHGNFHFAYLSPVPVGSHPAGASAWGVHELVGNGWEWTQSVFGPFPGFHTTMPSYPGYSADFFDGKHYVLKGASWATDLQLLRRSFRNWYQARYPYVFAKFRCVRTEERA